MSKSEVARDLEAVRNAGAAADAVVEALRHRLLGISGAGAELAALLGATADEAEPDEAAVALLAGALGAARTAIENDQAGGARFLSEVTAQVEALDRAAALAPTARMVLAGAFVRAGLPAPSALALAEEPAGFEDAAPLMLPPEVEPMLDALTEAAEDPAAAHGQMSEMLGAMPPGLRRALVATIARRQGPPFDRMAAYFLLDRDAGLRRAAAEGLLARTTAGNLDAASAGRVALLRSWLPADAARDTLDRLLRAAAERQAFGGAAPAGWTLAGVFGSIPDGTGAFSMAVGARRGRRRVIAMILIKQGFGVKDAYVVECGSAAEHRRMLEEMNAEMDGVAVGVDHVDEMLAMALADGLEAGLPPAPGLIDVAEIAGFRELRPQPLATEAMTARFAVAGWSPRRLAKAAAGSAFWIDEHVMVEHWFEDSSAVRAILEAHPDDVAAAEELAPALEARRDWWARICALTALTLKAAGDPDAAEFAGVAHLLATGAPLDEIAIIETIIEGTLAARAAGAAASTAEDWDEEDAAEPDWPGAASAPEPEEPGELERLLARADLTPMWLEGFAMAVAVAPKLIRPGDWLGEVMERGPQFRGMDAMQRYLDLVVDRANAATLATDDAAQVRARIAATGPEDLGEWARGFGHVVRRFNAAWRHKSLAREDSAMLALIDAVGRGAEDAQLRPVLAPWLARRRAMTR